MYAATARRLYVLELEDGTVKGGIARGDGQLRIRQHQAAVKVARFQIGDKYVTGFKAEDALLTRLAGVGAIVRGREWFSGVTFKQAAQFLAEVTAEFAHAEQAPQESPLLRKHRANLSLNEEELKVLDAYCAHAGLERSTACRKLLMDGIVEMLGSHGAKNFAPKATFNHRQVS